MCEHHAFLEWRVKWCTRPYSNPALHLPRHHQRQKLERADDHRVYIGAMFEGVANTGRSRITVWQIERRGLGGANGPSIDFCGER